MVQWLRQHVHRPKDPGYAERVLERYRMGRRAGGAVSGVRILTGPDSCPHCRAVGGGVYTLDEVPRLPIAACTHPDGCRCTYTAVMAYEMAL